MDYYLFFAVIVYDLRFYLLGRIIHGKAFKNADGYRGKRVVVVGFGNSAADIAVSLAGVATKVLIETNTKLGNV